MLLVGMWTVSVAVSILCSCHRVPMYITTYIYHHDDDDQVGAFEKDLYNQCHF